MRIFTFLIPLCFISLSLFAQQTPEHPPAEILYEAFDGALGRIAPQWKKTFRRDNQGNPLYEAHYTLDRRSPEGLHWVLEREIWKSYFSSGKEETRYTIEHTPIRITTDEAFSRAGALRTKIRNVYAPDSEELIESMQVENSLFGVFVQSTTTSFWDFSTNSYVPATRKAYTYDGADRLWKDWVLNWNITSSAWDTVQRATWQYISGSDSSIVQRNEETLNPISDLWEASNLSYELFDSLDRPLEVLRGSDQAGYLRILYSYNDSLLREDVVTDTLPPGGSWTPVSIFTYDYKPKYPWPWSTEVILTDFSEKTQWNPDRQSFNKSLWVYYGFDGKNRIASESQSQWLYDPVSDKDRSTYIHLRHTYSTYCDGRLLRKTVGPNNGRGNLVSRTSYAYATKSSCGDIEPDGRLILAPNPINAQVPFLQLRSSWLINPGVEGEIIDLMGRRHKQFSSKMGYTQDIDVSDLKQGTYILRLYHDGKSMSKTLIVTE